MVPEAPILWITPKWPFPCEDGARLATVNLVRELTALGRTIELLAFVDRGIDVNLEEVKTTLGLHEVHVLRTTPAPKLLPLRIFHYLGHLFRNWRLPLTCAKYSLRTIHRSLDTLLKGDFSKSQITETTVAAPEHPRRFSAVVYDGLHGAAHSVDGGEYVLPPRRVPVFYRAHNCETQIWERKARLAQSILTRTFFEIQSKRVREFELSLLRKSTRVLTVSEKEREIFSQMLPRGSFGVVPIGYDMPAHLPNRERARELLFVGRLDWPPNREGLVWFLDRVWPEVSYFREDLSLTIVGSGNGSYLSRFRTLPRVAIVGRVDSVEPYYRRALAAIVPLFYGSGIRVKAIEASAFGCPLISTALGVEGLDLTPGESFLHAETEEEWIYSLRGLSFEQSSEIARKAFERISTRFEPRQCAEQFSTLFDESFGDRTTPPTELREGS